MSDPAPFDPFALVLTDIHGQPYPMAVHKASVLLVVNTASACGFTPQLGGLEALHRRYRDDGLVVIGFPCNQFGGQDPLPDADIAAFCQRNHGVSFPMMAKTEVNGPHAHPLWRWLKAQVPGVWGTRAIKWNFTKFLVGHDGRVLRRFAPQDPPDRLQADVQAALAARQAAQRVHPARRG